ncbi:MAG TPA: hypothetical protein VMF88_12120 [Bacteroidota bacterium]|nr:hypothetical protein [Bacteroidota bacterium]
MNNDPKQYEYCHVRETTATLILIPHGTFSRMSQDEIKKKQKQLQETANELKLDGSVALCWKDKKGNTVYFAPPNWKEFLEERYPVDYIVGKFSGKIVLR